jgi:Protein of unknown function (DUF2948)
MLKLTAQDGDDLAVISAQMQDAVLKFIDMRYDAKRRRFALVANRFAWDAAPAKLRRRTGLHFDGVLGVQRAGFEKVDRNSVLSLLAINFSLGEVPGGVITLLFAGGPSLKLNVECLDAAMADLGAAWSTEHQPEHVN